MALHMWRNHVVDWYVAESAEEARELARKYMREQLGMHDEEMDLRFTQEPDGKLLKFTDDEGVETVKTCAMWAATRPKGFWGTTEF